MLDYASLFALAAVVREGSFDRAARRLHVTPSAISQRIRLLEERIGCPLVTRGQPCEATEAGRQLCHHADRVQLLEQELRHELPSALGSDAPQASLPVAVNADSLATWFVQAAADFSANAPVLVEVSVDDEGHTARWLRSGKVLAAVTAEDRPTAGCSCVPLGLMPYVAVASPIFVERYFAGGIGAGGLARAPSLLFNVKDELQQRWVRRLCGRSVDLPRHTLPSTHAFVAATIAGMGWAMHPIALVAEHLSRGELIELDSRHRLEVPLFWQQARVASRWMDALGEAVLRAAKLNLLALSARSK